MLLIIAFIISQLATVALALSMPKHFRQIIGSRNQTPLIRLVLKLSGWGLVALTVVILGLEQSTSLAITEYLGVVTINIIITALSLDFFNRKISLSKM